jgi:hypothetical protein
MSTEKLLDELADAGIHLVRGGETILADVEERADLVLHAGRIAENKSALLAALRLREQIVAAATAEVAFDRVAYDALWDRWRRQQEHEGAGSCQ